MGNSTLNSLYRNLGLEDLVEEPPVEEVPADLSGEESVEGALVDALPEQEAAETDVEQIDDLGGDLETLENVKEAMENACAQSMLSKDAVVFARLAVASVYRRWGVTADPVPSMESIDPATTVSQMRVSMEGLGDTLKKWWQAFMAKLKGMINNVKQFVMKMLDASPKIKARAESIKKAAASGKPIDGKIKDFKRSTIQLGAKVATGDEIAAEMEHLQTMATEIGKTYEKVTDEHLAGLGELVKKEGQDATNTPAKIVRGHVTNVKTTWAKWRQDKGGVKEGTNETTVFWTTPFYLGNIVLQANAPKDIPDDAPISLLSKVGYGIANITAVTFKDNADANIKPLDKGEVDPLNVDAINKICDGVIKVCEAVAGLKAGYAKNEAAVNRLLTESQNAVNAAKGDDAEVNTRLRNTLAAVAAGISSDRAFRQKAMSLMLGSSRSALEYCAKSFQGGEATKEEPKAEGAAE